MDRSDIATLISAAYEKDAYGVTRASETGRDVFVAVRSASQSEYFAGAQQGLRPEYQITMFAPDYNGEKVIEYNGERFTIYRTYRGRDDTLELYVQREAGV